MSLKSMIFKTLSVATVSFLIFSRMMIPLPSSADSSTSLSDLSASFQELSLRVMPAIVEVNVTGYGSIQDMGQQVRIYSPSSGVVVQV